MFLFFEVEVKDNATNLDLTYYSTNNSSQQHFLMMWGT
jgi:hypothetical protein